MTSLSLWEIMTDRQIDRRTNRQTNRRQTNQQTDIRFIGKLNFQLLLDEVNCFVNELMIDYAWRMDENRANEGDIDNKVR